MRRPHPWLFLALFTLLAALAPGVAAADGFRVDVHEDALTRLARRVGGLSFSGHHTIRGPLTGVVLCSASWSATLSDVQFSISPSGVTYTAKLKASYSVFSYSTTVSGTASVGVQSDHLIFSLNQLDVPVKFYIPVLNTWVEVYRIKKTLPYSFSVPFGAGQLQTNAGRTVSVIPGRITREYRWGSLRLWGEVFVQ